MNIDIKLAPMGIMNIDRNFQEVDDISYSIGGVDFINVGDSYYIQLTDFHVLYKNEKYQMTDKAYVFIGTKITLELEDFNLRMSENFISLFVDDFVLFLDYNTDSFTMDNRIILGVYSNISGWKKLC